MEHGRGFAFGVAVTADFNRIYHALFRYFDNQQSNDENNRNVNR